jgi:hypothetical protein
MTTDKYTVMNIRFSQEECSILEQALDILRKTNQEIDDYKDVDEVRLSDSLDKKVLQDISNELDELGCAVEF